MITPEEAEAAARMVRWCAELEGSEAYQRVVLATLAEKKDELLAAGLSVGKPAAERAEFHRAYHLAVELEKLVGAKREQAQAVLDQWQEENGAGKGGYG